MKEMISNSLAHKISELLISARKSVVQTVNHTMVLTYFEIGRIIVEEEQKGEERAEYGKYLLKRVSERLTNEFGRGFSETNLKQMRQFYQMYSIGQTVSDQLNSAEIPQILSAEFKLSWSHYLKLTSIDDEFIFTNNLIPTH